MKTITSIYWFAFAITAIGFGGESRKEILADAGKAVTVSNSAVLTQALGRVDLSISGSRVNMRQVQGAFGEHQAATNLNRGAEWAFMRQRLAPQGIDMLHLEIHPDGRIKDMMVSEVKTGGSRLGQTLSGMQMTFGWSAARLKILAKHYGALSLAVSKGEVRLARTPSAISQKHVLEVPLGNRSSAQFWRESVLSPWKLNATPSQVSLVERQSGQIAQWLNAAADGRISYRSRIFRQELIEGGLVMTVKDAALLSKGVPESKLPVLNRTVTPFKGGGSVAQSLTSAFAGELRRTQPMLSDVEVTSQARDLARKTMAESQGFKPTSLSSSLAKGASASMAGGGVLAGAFDWAVQLGTSGEVDFQQLGGNVLVGGTAGATGYFAGSGVTYALTNTTLGLNLSRQVASSMGISTSYSANLLGSTTGGGVAAAVFSYGMYLMGYADLEAANRMAVAGVTGSVVGSVVVTSMIATYGTAGTGAAIATLHGAAATSAIAAASGTALAWTGVGLIAVGVGAGVMWAFDMYDETQEAKRQELTANYLIEHYQMIMDGRKP